MLFVPAGQPWLKADLPVTDARHRARMVDLAIQGNPCFEASRMELERDGPTYTVDTLEELASRSMAELYLIVGADVVSEFDRWQRPRRILQLATIAIVARPGAAGRMPLSFEAFGSCVSVHCPPVDVSATEVRSRVGSGRTVRYMVPDAVDEYIVTHGLYTDE